MLTCFSEMGRASWVIGRHLRQVDVAPTGCIRDDAGPGAVPVMQEEPGLV